MIFIFKEKTAYDMRISDWSSDVCASDLFDVRKIVQSLARGGDHCRADVDACHTMRALGDQFGEHAIPAADVEHFAERQQADHRARLRLPGAARRVMQFQHWKSAWHGKGVSVR